MFNYVNSFVGKIDLSKTSFGFFVLIVGRPRPK